MTDQTFPHTRTLLSATYLKTICLLLFVLVTGPVFSQQKASIQILHADSAVLDIAAGRNILINNVRMRHDDFIMKCDTLYQYSEQNYIEAFGHIHVVQNDTLNLWGDYMTYDGNTRLVKIRRNVTLQNQQVILTTHFLDYNALDRIGHYFNQGTLKDSTSTLNSRIGYYYLNSNEAFFRDSVRVYTSEYEMHSDTMKYNTQNKIITIIGPTTIYGENRTLYSEDGWYNSLTSHAELYKNNSLTYNEYLGKADTMVIDSITATVVMKQHIHLYDTVNNILVEGHYGEVFRENDSAFVTSRALLTMIGKQDSLFLHGDTLFVVKDTAGNNLMKAYHHVKFFNPELRGIADSVVFPVADSTIYLYAKSGDIPIVWAAGNQMTATTIHMRMSNNQIERFYLNNKAMIVNQLDSVQFNQIKGRDMIGHMRNNELYLVDVNGSGETLYYPDDKGTIIGLNKATSSYLKIYLQARRVKDIVFISSVEGNLNPTFLVTSEERFLKDFMWLIEKQPAQKEDIFLK